MKTLKALALAALVVPLFLVGEEDTHVEIGTRLMNEEAKAQIQAEKEKRAQEEEEEELQVSGFIFDRYPPVYYSNSHHWLVAVTVLDNDKFSIEFEDGSVWKVNSYDGPKALNWRANDPLTVTQNNRWFSSFDYRVLNKSNGTSIEANLFLGPIEQGQYTRYIVAIDLARREMVLNDSTHWEISYLDTPVFKDWALADAVIIGTNSRWDSACDALLINVNMNNCARAKQF